MADHSKPALTDLYSNWTSLLGGRIDDAVKQNRTDTVTLVQPPTGMIRWNVSTNKWEYNSGTPVAPVWTALSANYDITVKNLTGGVITLGSSLRQSHTTAGVSIVAGNWYRVLTQVNANQGESIRAFVFNPSNHQTIELKLSKGVQAGDYGYTFEVIQHGGFSYASEITAVRLIPGTTNDPMYIDVKFGGATTTQLTVDVDRSASQTNGNPYTYGAFADQGTGASGFECDISRANGWIHYRAQCGIGVTWKMHRTGQTWQTAIASASRFVSEVANGTAPFGCTSTTVVPNLNADMLDGYHSTSFAPTASPTFTGTITIPYGSIRGWTAADTAIDALIGGNTNGVLVEATSCHYTVAINANDAGDGFQVIGKAAGDAYATYSEKWLEANTTNLYHKGIAVAKQRAYTAYANTQTADFGQFISYYNIVSPSPLVGNYWCGIESLLSSDTGYGWQMVGESAGTNNPALWIRRKSAGAYGTYARIMIGGTLATWNDSLYSKDLVTNMLSWKHYGNNHCIFDASNSTSPTGSAISNTTPTNAWVATYPTLMGWNGTQTYGVRVDVAARGELLKNYSGRTDSTWYPVTWMPAADNQPAYSCSAVQIQSSTGKLWATTLLANDGASGGVTVGSSTATYMRMYAVQAGGVTVDGVINVTGGSGTETLDLQIDAVSKLKISGANDYVDLPKGQIKFPATQNASSDANVLDDYEEGNVTLRLYGGTSGSGTNVTATGKYTKIGRLVHLDYYFAGVNTTGMSGGLIIDQLPFAHVSGTASIGTILAHTLLNSTGNFTSMLLDSGGSAMYAYSTTNAGAWIGENIVATASGYIYGSITYPI